MISYLGRPFGSFVIPVIGICNPWHTAVQALDDEGVLAVEFRELRLDIDFDQRVDQIRGLRGH